jgi:hypothetical protein
MPGVNAVTVAQIAKIEVNLAVRKGYATSVPVFPLVRRRARL